MQKYLRQVNSALISRLPKNWYEQILLYPYIQNYFENVFIYPFLGFFHFQLVNSIAKSYVGTNAYMAVSIASIPVDQIFSENGQGIESLLSLGSIPLVHYDWEQLQIPIADFLYFPITCCCCGNTATNAQTSVISLLGHPTEMTLKIVHNVRPSVC